MKQTFRLLIALVVVFAGADSAFGQMKYPYVKDSDNGHGPVIVSRDAQGGVHPDALKGDNDNAIGAMFQIAPKDAVGTYTWAEATANCGGGWRLPTKRELQLIWLLGGASAETYDANAQPISDNTLNEYPLNDFTPLSPTEYWSYTPNNHSGWSVNFTNGQTSSGADKLNVRCIRDYKPNVPNEISYTQEGSLPMFSISSVTANYGSPVAWNEQTFNNLCQPPTYSVPSVTELQLMWAYKEGFIDHSLGNLATDIYWSSSKFINVWWVLYMQKGNTTGSDKDSYIRCIRRNQNAGVVYPYVEFGNTEGPIIVSRDNNGGVNDEALSVNGNTDGVAPKLQVAKYNTDWFNWNDAMNSCPAGWRLPTQQELMLIWIMGGAQGWRYGYDGMIGEHLAGDNPLYSDTNNFTTLALQWHWTSTNDDTAAATVNMSWGDVGQHGKGSSLPVRCVRTVE